MGFVQKSSSKPLSGLVFGSCLDLWEEANPRCVEKVPQIDHPSPFSSFVGVAQVVVSILDTANSSYLAPFNVLSQRIKEGSVEANNNLKFLESITSHCQNVSMIFALRAV